MVKMVPSPDARIAAASRLLRADFDDADQRKRGARSEVIEHRVRRVRRQPAKSTPAPASRSNGMPRVPNQPMAIVAAQPKGLPRVNAVDHD